jgi:ABC-type nitrate/sulfonate/bicarbonate transport system substrate-binding protein
MGHPSDNIAVALSVGEKFRASGLSVIASLALGYEIYCRMQDIIPARGTWDHTTASALAAPLIAGRLMGLTAEQLAHAAALSATHGNTLAVVSMSTLVVREIVARSGLDPDRDVTYLAVGGSETRSGAMAAGFVDAALMIIPMNYTPERQGYNRLAWGPDYVRYPTNGISGLPDYFAANRDLVLAVLRGVAGGIRDVKQRKSEMITFLKSYLEVPEDEAAKSYEFLVSHMPDNMIVDDAVIRQAMEFAASALKLKPDAVPDISKVRDGSYARTATK